MVVELKHGPSRITINEDQGYTYGSADNIQSYVFEYLLNCSNRVDIISNCAIQVTDEFEEVVSCILLANGYWTHIHEHSVIVHDNSCIVAVGCCVASVSLPHLQLEWSKIVDDSKCEEIHTVANGKNLITRGSNRIACLTYRGKLIWEIKGGYEFFNGFCLHEKHLEIIDWDHNTCCLDLATGCKIK